jgi:hypothetical protein
MKIHELKSWPQFFEKVVSGEKTFEVRLDDRNFKVGDFLYLREYDPKALRYSGRFQYARITYILDAREDRIVAGVIHSNYVVLAISLYWSALVPVLPGQEGSQTRPEPFSVELRRYLEESFG